MFLFVLAFIIYRLYFFCRNFKSSLNQPDRIVVTETTCLNLCLLAPSFSSNEVHRSGSTVISVFVYSLPASSGEKQYCKRKKKFFFIFFNQS